MEIGLIALPTFSICNPAQKSSRQIKINNLPLEWPAKTPADRGKSVNGGRGDGWNDVLRKDVVPAEQMMCLRMMCRCTAMAEGPEK